MYDSRDDEDIDDDDEGQNDEDRERLLVFGTRRNIEILMKCSQWFVDGTFKSAAYLFLQLFTILGLVKSPPLTPGGEERKTALPLVYALMTSKRQEHYAKVFETVRSAARRFRVTAFPSVVMSDFEMSILNAVRALFPDSTVRACFFHLGQSMYRKVQSLGLQEAYNDPQDRSVKEAVHSMLALAFVPVADLVATFLELERTLAAPLKPVARYLDETYIRGPRARGARRRGRPRYEPHLWNTYESTLRDEHRTNNMNEGWHNRFQVRWKLR